ncbi:MAG: protein phosphatase 2C domain-containing protein [Propionibacteriaceae bacterium]|jgi:protein phosphatase|nr:protein phosphatase 2C domain-containing protein [Propionibacteriaceae bacterium]
MTLALNYLAHSEIGLVRKNNQDSAYVSPTMMLVADGMGGAAAGDLASAVVVRIFRAIDAPFIGEEMLDMLGQAVEAANEQIAELVHSDSALDGMGSTVVGGLFDGEQLGLVNVGDSRAYLYRDGKLTRLTHDHSWVQSLVDEGRLTEEDALTHPHRSLILRVINGQEQHTPDLSLVPLQEGDRILICSDGLSGSVLDDALEERMGGTLEEARDALVELAHDMGGTDNITMILADAETAVEGVLPPDKIILGAAALINLDEPLEEITAQIPLLVQAQTEEGLDEEELRYKPTGRRRIRHILKVAAAIFIPVLMVAVAAMVWFGITQQQYYVGNDGGKVAIFKGVPGDILGLPLSSVVEESTTNVDDLPPFYKQKVDEAITVGTVDEGRATIVKLHEYAENCIVQRNQPSMPTPVEPSPEPPLDPTASPAPEDEIPEATPINPPANPQEC